MKTRPQTKTDRERRTTTCFGVCVGVMLAALSSLPAPAQVMLSPGQLDQLVSRVALYPDPLLAQVLTAATYEAQIPDAAQWAAQHSYLTADNLAAAINEDNLPWDPSVLALMPFPSVLDMMAGNIFWTRQLGDAVLGQRPDVMDAVQRMRQKARALGYLQSGPQYRVVLSAPGIIEILPLDPGFYFLPIYDPLIVFGRPRVGMVAGITFGPRVVIGAAFAPWGWGRSGFTWATHTLTLDGRSWMRTRDNHLNYTHPYVAPRIQTAPRVERHEQRPAVTPARKDRRDDKK